jgi:hypothetical protein
MGAAAIMAVQWASQDTTTMDTAVASSGEEGEVVDCVAVAAEEAVADEPAAEAAADAAMAAGLGGTEEEALVAEDKEMRSMSSNLYLPIFSYFSFHIFPL